MPSMDLLPRLRGMLGRGMVRLGSRVASIEPGQSTGFAMGAPVLSGVVVTPQTALTFMAVYAAINTISTDVAKLPLRVMRRGKGSIAPYPKDPRTRLLGVAPNGEMNAFRFWKTSLGHVLGWGNAYSEIERDGAGMPVALWPLHPGTIRPRREEKSRALYYEDTSTARRYLPENILHIAGLSFDGIQGYSPILLGRQAVGLGLGAEQFGASFFGNGAIPKGMLKIKNRLTDGAARRMREDFDRQHAGTQNANRVAVLEEGTEWVDTQIAPDAAQFLVTRQFQVLEIARMFNLPPSKLQDYSQAHLTNMEEGNRQYLESTLTGWLEAIVSEVNLKLFFEDEQARFFVLHDTSALMRGNTQARGEFYKTMKMMGVMNADTIAGLEGLPQPGPDNGGDLYLVQSQNVPQQLAGKPQPKPAPAPTIPSVKPDENAPSGPAASEETP